MHVPHNKLWIEESYIKAVSSVIKKGEWSLGKEVNNLENKLKSLTDREYCVAVNSGLSALRIALIALGVKNNDEVVLPSYSCVALANAVLSLGAKIIPVDVSKKTFNLTYDLVKDKISNRTKAIIVVHTFGNTAPINDIRRLGIPIVEDCAHALGIKVNDINIGNMGDISICSFYSTKLIGGGEGGAVIMNNKDYFKTAYDLREYSDKGRDCLKINYRLSDIHAALIVQQLFKIQEFLFKREQIARFYIKHFEYHALSDNINYPDNMERRVWYRFIIQIKNNEIVFENFMNYMSEKNIQVRRPVELWLNNEESIINPNTVYLFNNNISLPIYPNLKENQQLYVIEHITKFFKTN